MKNEVNRAPWAKKKTFLFILALCATTLAWGAEVTISKSIKDIAAEWAWPEGGTEGVQIPSFRLGQATVTVTGNNGYYYSSKTSWKWHCYMARDNGKFTITVPSVCKLKSVTFSFTEKNSGDAVNYNGTNYASGASIAIAGLQTASFTVGNTNGTTGGQVRLSSISLTYDMENGVTEDFNVVPTFGTTDTEASGVLVWNVHRVRHSSDKMSDGTSIGCCTWGDNDATYHNSYMATKTEFEGGIKYVEVLWKQMGSEKNNTMKLVAYSDDANPKTIFEQAIGNTGLSGDHITGVEIEAKSNAVLKIQNESFVTATPATGAAGRFTIGSITIVPYLRYTYTEMQEVKIGEGTFDCSLQIDNTDDEGTITYSSDNTDVVSFASESSPIATLNGGGEATITATWSEGASTSFKLKVIAKSTPEISFENEAITITNLYTTEPVANELTVTEDAGEVSYTSSNPLVAQIVSNQVTVVGVGTATITATTAENDDYVSASASYALTVNEPEGETAVKENFKGKLAKQDSYTDTEAPFTDQLGLYSWKANGYRYNETWVRLKTTETPYLKFDGNQEGGIKRLIFTWFRAGNATELKPIHTSIKVMDGDNELKDASINLVASADHINQLPYNCRIEVKQNAQLVIDNTSADGAVMHFQDISIVPYVLYTEKAQTANAENGTYDATIGLINNAPVGEVTYSIVTEDAQATIDEATGEVDMANVIIAEDIEIKAAYGDAYTTMMLHIDALPEPEITFGKTTYTINEAFEAPTVTVKGEPITPTISYTSSNENVAVVNGQNITFIGTGTTKITASVDATDEYKEASTDGEITVTAVAPSMGNYWPETFSKMSASSYVSTVTSIDGDTAVYSWSGCNFRRNGTDDKVGATQGFRLRYSGTEGYVEFDDNQEGGIKDVYFKWRLPGNGQQHVKFNVAVDDDIRKIDIKDVTASADNILECQQRFDVKKNAKLKISIPESGYTAVVFSNLYITPYLLYTKKYDEVKLSKGLYVNTDLINNTNTDGTITFSAEPAELVEFQQNPTYPGTVNLNGAGEVTITATWTPSDAADGEVVTTSYVLKINDKEYMDAHFETEGKLEKVIGNVFTNAVSFTKGEGTVNYSSDDTNVAEVDDAGKVTIKGIGTTTIKAHLDETDNYFAWDGSYTVVARTGVPAEKKLVEAFSEIETSEDIAKANTPWTGDVAEWKVYNTRRGQNDTIDNAQATWIRFQGYAKTEVLEGGIKYFTFNWKQWATESGNMKMTVQLLGVDPYSQEFPATSVDIAMRPHYFFAYNAAYKKNTSIEVKNESYNDGGLLTSNGRITFDAFEIVPYLFYKTKSHKIDVVKGDAPTWTNTDLINNTEGDGTIVYSIEDVEGEGVAEIDATSGQVTAKSNGKAKVTATWTPTGALEGEVVTTTYTLDVFYSKLDAELAFDPEEITVGEDAIAFSTPTLSNPHGLTVTYSSDKEDIATVDENSGEVTLIGVAGDVVISATSEETDTYQEGNASYTIHVLPLPDVTFPNLTGNKKTVDMDQVPFTETILIKVNEEDVTSSATITYESSNEEVAIIKDNEVNLIGVGTAYITAKIDQTETYAGRDVYYTLTVEDDTPAEKQWTETFSSIGNVNDYITSRKADIVGDSSIYSWAMRNYRRKQTQADSLATEQAIRLSNAKNNYIETLNNQEGGIKRISFNWRTPGTEAGQLPINLNVSVCYNNYQDTVKRPMTRAKSKDNMTDNLYCSNFFVKQNAKLKIDIADAAYSVMLIGPITITPYLLYTTKSADLEIPADDESATYKNTALIDNRDNEVAISYSVSGGASVDDEGTVTVSAAGEYTVTASWNEGKVTTTYTLKVTKAEDPVVEPNFVLENKTAGAISTICLPKKIASVENATLYSISHGNTSKIEFVEADLENDAAGMPYLVLVEADGNVNFYYGEGDAVDAPVSVEDAKGFVGSLQEEPQEIPSDGSAILVSGGQLYMAGEWCVLTKNHAYIDSNNLPASAPVGGAPRRTIRLYNPDAAPTNLVESESESGKAMKVLRDGQFYIIRDTKTYNAQGILVE